MTGSVPFPPDYKNRIKFILPQKENVQPSIEDRMVCQCRWKLRTVDQLEVLQPNTDAAP
jgi:hypothetical protein